MYKMNETYKARQKKKIEPPNLLWEEHRTCIAIFRRTPVPIPHSASALQTPAWTGRVPSCGPHRDIRDARALNESQPANSQIPLYRRKEIRRNRPSWKKEICSETGLSFELYGAVERLGRAFMRVMRNVNYFWGLLSTSSIH